MSGRIGSVARSRDGASRLQSLSSLSIGMRLAFGFGLIAVLFLLANYFSRENATAITRSFETSNIANRNLDHAARTLIDALTTYQRAVRERIVLAGLTATEKNYSTADTALKDAVDDYAKLNYPVAGILDAKQLTSAVQALQAQVKMLLVSAKHRDDFLNSYWTAFDHLQQQLTQPQQSAWRIGDRSFTRHSLSAMLEALLAVRNAVGAYLAAPNSQRAVVVDLQEENFLLALVKNSKALGAAQGEPWVKNLHADFEKLRRLHRGVRDARAKTQSEFAAISASSDELLKTVQTGISEPASKALLDSARLAAEIAQRTDRSVALLSVGCLGLILIISWLTAKSVTVPVKRLLQATYKLASGDDLAHVTRGGARELDQLAAAFNDMTHQLAVAKRGVIEHQAHLEERVAARTQQLHHLAYHDALTQLPNRRHLFKYLNSLIEDARKEHRSIVLLLLDLDNFKTLNDSLGHLFGDRVLKAVSERLLETVQDHGFAARLGGDEFTLVRELHSANEDIAAQTQLLLSKFQQPLHVDDREIIVGLSVGAGVFPDHADDAESLLRAADGALFKAKASGRNQTCISTPELIAQISGQFKTEQALRRAIQCNELELLFQPQMRLSSREVNAVEALVRWKRDDVYVLPLDFLPLAEQAGLITEITDWVLKRAVQTLAMWHHGAWPTAHVAVNVSSQQFIDRSFVSRLQTLLVAHNVPPSSLELELTENVLQSGAATVKTLQALRELGVGIALDDFGAGYSSLASLEQLQLSRVKIDRSLMENVDRNPRSASIACSMIELCRSLNLNVTTEGIERTEQLRFLYQCEDVDVQGFLLAQPLAADQVIAACKELPNRFADLAMQAKESYRGASNVTTFPRRGLPR